MVESTVRVGVIVHHNVREKVPWVDSYWLVLSQDLQLALIDAIRLGGTGQEVDPRNGSSAYSQVPRYDTPRVFGLKGLWFEPLVR